MPFDPSTAQPFDPSSAQSTVGGFDPSSAKPVQPTQDVSVPQAIGNFIGQLGQTAGDLIAGHPNHAPNQMEQGLMGAGQRTGAALDSAVSNNLLFQPVRAAMEWSGQGMDKLKSLYPGQSQQWYQSQLHQVYNQAVINSRQHAQQEQQQVDQQTPGWAGKAGQAALNIGTGLATNPEYMLIPGMAGTGGLASRLAMAGGSNAAIGSASDVAAQAMDMATGVKKNFDIQQNLESAFTAGAFGVGMHGAVEVAPFVKNLFSARGMDTTPSVDPRQSLQLSPMTGDHVAMNAADSMQYHQLLMHGSVDDIKGFFNGRNGPQPSWTDVNDWVEHRDNPPVSTNGVAGVDTSRMPDFDYNTEYNNHAEQQWKEQNRQAVEDHVTQQMSGWKNAPNVEVVHGPEDIADPAQRQGAMDADNGKQLGFFGDDGTVRMYSGRITGEPMANALLFHEGLGHFGLQQAFGDRLDSVIGSLLDRNVNNLNRLTDAWQEANPNAYGGDRTRAAEEVLAEASQRDGNANAQGLGADASGNFKQSWSDALGSTIRQFGRKMGFNIAASDAEVRQVLSMAHDAVINGKGLARDNGYSNGNRYMFIGKDAYGFDDNGPTADLASDGRFRNEIDDSQAKLKDPYWYEKPNQTLGDVLDHPELYKAYPDLKDLPVYPYNKDSRMSGAYGQRGDGSGNYMLINPDRSPDEQLMTALHESQHAIQHIEQYPDMMKQLNVGGSEAMSKEDYLNNMSEKEARITESRKDLTMQQRIDQVPPKYMTSDQFSRTEKDIASEAFDRLADGYDNRSTRSWDDAMDAARDTAINLDKLKRVRGIGDLDKRLFQYDNAAKELNDRLQTSAAKVVSGESLTSEEQAQRIQDVAQFHYVLGRIENDSAQIGRALNAMKAIEFSRNNLLGLKSLLDKYDSSLGPLSDPEVMQKFLMQYSLLGGTKGGQTLAATLNKPGWEKYALTLYRNMILSSVGTHIKAPMDMATGIALDIEDRVAAAGIGKVHDALQALGITKQGGMSGKEPIAYLLGTLKAITSGDAWMRAATTFTNLHAQTMRMGNTAPAVLPGIAGDITTIPTRLIAAQDAFFRAISTNAHLYGDGIAKSLNEGGNLSWLDHMTRGISYAENPTDQMIDKAADMANRTLLLGDNPFTKFLERGKMIKMGADPIDRAITALIDLVTPVIRVPANALLTRTIARSPLGLLDPETRAMFMAGGRQADVAISRMIVGTMKMAMFYGAANVVGGALTQGNKRKELEASGWRPGSVDEGDKYSTGIQLPASANPFDVHNQTAADIANMREAYRQGANGGQVAAGLMAATASLIHSTFTQLWTNDISEAMGMFSDSQQDAGAVTRTAQNIVGNAAVPGAVAQFRNLADPNQRDTIDPDSHLNSMVNAVKNRIPGLSESLPTRYSVYGDPMQTGTAPNALVPTHNWVTGGNQQQKPTDPAEQELNRLATSGLKVQLDNGDILDLSKSALITPVQRTVKFDGEPTRHLTSDEFEQYQKLAGTNIVAYVRQEMGTPEWQKMSDQDKVLEIKDIEKDMKKAAKEALFQ